MNKRLIGIDYDGAFLRVAVAVQAKGEAVLSSVAGRPCATLNELPAAVTELAGGSFGYGDAAVAALPAADGFVRTLTFPFADTRKIEAALDFELAAQLPVAAEACATAFRKGAATDGGCRVAAAATRREVLLPLLEVCDDAGVPLQVLDLAPHGYVAGLARECPEGVLASVSRREATVALVADGRVEAHRLLPQAGEREQAEVARFIRREAAALQREARTGELPLWLIGSGADDALLAKLGGARVPDIPLGDHPVAAEFLPAVALALRAGGDGFNFRRGPLALKSEWADLKKKLTVAGVLLGGALLVLAGSAYLGYAHKAGRAETLKEEMISIYRETFPGSRVIVDVPLQLRSGIRELEKQGQRIGVSHRSGALEGLREVSAVLPKELRIDVREFSYDPDGVRLAGATASFDAVNRMARALEGSPLFAAAQVAEAKMSLDGDRVDFRIDLNFSEGGQR